MHALIKPRSDNLAAYKAKAMQKVAHTTLPWMASSTLHHTQAHEQTPDPSHGALNSCAEGVVCLPVRGGQQVTQALTKPKLGTLAT